MWQTTVLQPNRPPVSGGVLTGLLFLWLIIITKLQTLTHLSVSAKIDKHNKFVHFTRRWARTNKDGNGKEEEAGKGSHGHKQTSKETVNNGRGKR
jgi:uncharacterized protein YxeA